jgi:hypothetical protein
LIKKTAIFSAWLLGVLLLVCLLHLGIFYARNLPIEADIFIICYMSNFVMALIVFIAMLLLAQKQSSYLGFVFLFGSVFKFAVFFTILQPIISLDGSLSRINFFIFFIPYITSLFVETYILVKWLKDID